MRSTSSCLLMLLIARYCLSRHIRENRFSWYLKKGRQREEEDISYLLATKNKPKIDREFCILPWPRRISFSLRESTTFCSSVLVIVRVFVRRVSWLSSVFVCWTVCHSAWLSGGGEMGGGGSRGRGEQWDGGLIVWGEYWPLHTVFTPVSSSKITAQESFKFIIQCQQTQHHQHRMELIPDSHKP